MARARKKSDDVYNARRRERRAAQRYLEQSRRSVGVVSEKNRALALEHLKNALATYSDKSKAIGRSAPIKSLISEFSLDSRANSYIAADKIELSDVIAKSKLALANFDIDFRRENEARVLLSNPSIGRKIFGGLVDIWGDKVKKGASASENRAIIQKALFDYFKVDSWADLIEILERNVGESLYSVVEGFEIYDTVRIALQKHVKGNTFVLD